MSGQPSSAHEGACHAFYIGDGYNVYNGTDVRVDIIEVTNAVPTLLFIMFLLLTFPFSIRRFCRGRRGQTGLVAYFCLIWATAGFRLLRFIVLWAVMKGDAPSSMTVVENVFYVVVLALVDTIEASVLILFANGIFGNPKWLDRRVILQSVGVFVITLTAQLVLTFVANLQLYQDDDPKNAPFWFTTEMCFTLAYLLVILFRFLPQTSPRFPRNPLILVYLALLTIMHALSAIGQGLMMTHKAGAYCPIIAGNIAYYLISAPLLYATFLGSYLHPNCGSKLCCRKSGYQSVPDETEDDSLYEYQPAPAPGTVKSWIPPSQLNIKSPHYPRSPSGYFSSNTWSEGEGSTLEDDASSASGSVDDYSYGNTSVN